MGMPVTVEIVDEPAKAEITEELFRYFAAVDERFSTYKDTSEIMRINRGEIGEDYYSPEMSEVFALAELTKRQTHGYFDIKKPNGAFDPSGIVKGWAIRHAAGILLNNNYKNFYIDAGGDIQSHGKNVNGKEWRVGIRNPFNREEIIKVIYPRGQGVATSGTYVRGQHIYNPHRPEERLTDIVSTTVIGPDVLEADRFATGAFAMGREGINFIERLSAFEGYAIDAAGVATMTTGFEAYTKTL